MIPGVIETARLRLVPVTQAHVAALCRSRAALAALLGATVPDDWPVGAPDATVCPDALNFLTAQTEAGNWPVYFYLHRQDNRLVGDGGFKGRPDARGAVEIGYALVPAYRGQGLATEAAEAILAWAFAHPRLKAVTAETLPGGQASMRVLGKLGMTFREQGYDPAEGDVYRWEITRREYLARQSEPPLEFHCT